MIAFACIGRGTAAAACWRNPKMVRSVGMMAIIGIMTSITTHGSFVRHLHLDSCARLLRMITTQCLRTLTR